MLEERLSYIPTTCPLMSYLVLSLCTPGKRAVSTSFLKSRHHSATRSATRSRGSWCLFPCVTKRKVKGGGSFRFASEQFRGSSRWGNYLLRLVCVERTLGSVSFPWQSHCWKTYVQAPASVSIWRAWTRLKQPQERNIKPKEQKT